MAHGEQAVAGDEDEQLESGDDLAPDTEGSAEPSSKQPPILPSSVGLSVLLPAHASTDTGPDSVEVEVAWGEYLLRSTSEEVAALCRARGMNPDKYLPNGQRKQPLELWERVAVPRRTVTLDLGQAQGGKLISEPIPGAPGIALEYRVETITAADAQVLRIGEAGQGARALSVFLVNTRAVVTDRERDGRGYSRELNGQSLFQVEFRLHAGVGLLPRPDAHFANSQDFDDRMVDLQFRNEVEWVVGHGIAARPLCRDPGARRSPPPTRPSAPRRCGCPTPRSPASWPPGSRA